MGKVFENTGKKLCIYSDSGEFRLTATRRALMDEWNGAMHFVGSRWYIETHRRDGYNYVPYRFAGLEYIVKKKQDIMNQLRRSVQFKQAYAELSSG